jgi:CRISPR system Cascade subunit CasA
VNQRAVPPFDLTSQAWIPVTDPSGRPREVGLEQLFLEAHAIRRVAGETPPLTAALYRLLLALLHRVYGPADEQDWARMWHAPELDHGQLSDYLGNWRGRFDLFDPTRPFLQCPALASLPPSTPAKLLPHRAVGNNVTLFDHTIAGQEHRLSPAEAARWLVNAHAFDPGGMKTPFEKDKSSERAPCNYFGVVLVEGTNLKETLLLNALQYRPDDELPPMTTPHDRPAWEDDEAPSPRPDKRIPRGWTDLLTWPSRRVLLSPRRIGDQVLVTGAVITPGVRLDSYPVDEEKMAAFRRPSSPNGKPKRDAPLLPIRLHPLRGVWRHSVELLLTDVWEEGRTRIRPRTLEQLAELADHKIVPETATYTLRVFGQQLDKNASVVEAWMEEEVPAPVALLRATDPVLGALIGSAVALADDIGAALRHMQRDYLTDMRAEPTSALDLAYWPQLRVPFTTLLTALAEAKLHARPETDAMKAWERRVSAIARTAAERWAERAPSGERDVFTAAKHHGRFLGRLTTLVNTFHADAAKYISREQAA